MDEAYRALGRSENSVDQALGVALDVLLATPSVDGPIRIVPGKGATYAFADPRFETLTPAQKHLIRMGPENQRIIQTRLREIRDELTGDQGDQEVRIHPSRPPPNPVPQNSSRAVIS